MKQSVEACTAENPELIQIHMVVSKGKASILLSALEDALDNEDASDLYSDLCEAGLEDLIEPDP